MSEAKKIKLDSIHQKEVRNGRTGYAYSFDGDNSWSVEDSLRRQNFRAIEQMREQSPPIFFRFDLVHVKNAAEWSEDFRLLVVECIKEGSLVPFLRMSSVRANFCTRFGNPFERIRKIAKALGLWEDLVKRFTPLFFDDVVLPNYQRSNQSHVGALLIMQAAGGRVPPLYRPTRKYPWDHPEHARKMYKLLSSRKSGGSIRVVSYHFCFIVSLAFNVPLRKWLRKGYELEHAGNWTKIPIHGLSMNREGKTEHFIPVFEMETRENGS